MIWFFSYLLVGFIWFISIVYKSGKASVEDVVGMMIVPFIWPIAMPMHYVLKYSDKIVWRKK